MYIYIHARMYVLVKKVAYLHVKVSNVQDIYFPLVI